MAKLFNVLVKIVKPDGTIVWEAVRPTHGVPYKWDKKTAEQYVERYSLRGELKIKEV